MTAGDAYLYRKRNPGTESKIRSGIFYVEKHGKKKTAYLVIKKLGSENEK